MSRVPYLPSLQRIANADAIDGNERSPYHDQFALDRIEQALREGHEAARRPQPRLPRAERAENMLYAAQANSKALQRVTQYIPKNVPKERLAQQAEIALASFKAGVCVSANLDIGQFDSHANNDPRPDEADPRVPRRHRLPAPPGGRTEDPRATRRRRPERDGPHAQLQRRQRQGPLVDRLGDVPRPRHQGNRVIGATDEKQFAVPLDPRTLKTDDKTGVRVRPEHVHESLRELAGIADHPLSKKFPLGLKDEDKLQGLWKRRSDS